jgi:CheY-like chemotaxis protein
MPSVPQPKGYQILHVDDDPLNLRVVADVMGCFGHHAFGACSGEMALEELGSRVFDLVLLDIHMPGMSGIEVLRRLRESVGPERWTPVIALTADTYSRSRQNYLDLGFQDLVIKPILVAQLLDTVVNVITRAGQANERRLRMA